VTAEAAVAATPGERKVRRAMERFDRLQAQVDNLEARVRSYDVGGPAAEVWNEAPAGTADPAIEAELEALKARLAQQPQEAAQA
jgi:phage shock protein A